MKRILCILSALTAGGAETFLMKIYRAVPQNEYQFDFVVSEEGGCYTEEVLQRGGRIFSIPKRTEDFYGAMKGIVDVVHRNKYQFVIKLGNPPIAGLDLIAARIGGAKKLAMRSCNALTGLSLKNWCIHAHKDVHLIHNGVDLNIYHFDNEGRRCIQEEFSLQDKLVVGHIGRFHKQKNHRYLLEVFQGIRQRRPDAMLLLVGIGDLEDQIREWAKELNLDTSVIFTGQRFDIPQLLSAMDVFVFPSLHEGMPNTVIEAQATGLPCVIADTITREADITGLVTYLPLAESKEVWVDTVLSAVTADRRDTSEDFLAHGYDIKTVAKELVELLCG